jgi:2-phospho-L-lactate guanylyltransferase
VQLAVLIPVKAFSTAKGRLATVLSPAQRAELARRTATAVLRAAGVQPTFVVCDDNDVAEWAEANGATVLWRPGHGLNPAVADGVATLAGKGYDHAIVAHSDLLLADRLDHLAWAGGITLVPDRIHDGTNVISLPTALPFGFSYGGGSFHRHLAEAARLEHPARVVRDERLGLDIDTPSDLAHPSIQEALSSPPTSRANRP